MNNYCAQVVKTKDYPGYLTTLLSPLKARQTIFATRAFNAELSLVQSQTKDPMKQLIKIQFWKDEIEKAFEGKATHPITRELKVNEFNLSKTWFMRILREREKHLQREQFATIEELEQYAENTVSCLLYLHLEALGVRNQQAEHAAGHLGIYEITRKSNWNNKYFAWSYLWPSRKTNFIAKASFGKIFLIK
jgi:NADH dehydrogenase [ubiquinone] 1 alpha subcomplex assembly factor 6